MRANQFLSASFLHIDESDGTDAKYLENRPAVYSWKMTMYLIYYYKNNLVGIKRNMQAWHPTPYPQGRWGE